MKKNLLDALVVALVIMSACTSNTTRPQKSDIYSNVQPSYYAVDSLGITSDTTLSDNFTHVNSLNLLSPWYVPMRYTNRAEWSKYIFDKYGIELNVIYPENMLYTNWIEEYLKINGNCILYLNITNFEDYQFNNQIFKYSKENLSYDLSPYYIKYGWDRLISPEYIEAMKVDGKIYAVPASNPQYIYPRHYNLAYLKELNYEVPSTVDEFYEFLKGVRTLKPDILTFYPMCIDSQYITPSTSDIFRAFGVYVNSEFNSMISYNPMTNSFEDAVYADNMELALEYFKNLQHENLLFLSGESYYDNANGNPKNIYSGLCHDLDKVFATEYRFVYHPESGSFPYEGNFECAFENLNGFYLTGINTKKVCEIRDNIAFYMFPKTIENIHGTIDLFDDIFTDSAYFADLRFGLQDKDYDLFDGIAYPKENPGSYLSIKQINPVENPMYSYIPESTPVINTLPSELCFVKSVFNQAFTYSHSYGISNAYQHFGISNRMLLDSLFNKEVSTFDSILEYKLQFEKSGRREYIETLNENLGSITTYDYD